MHIARQGWKISKGYMEISVAAAAAAAAMEVKAANMLLTASEPEGWQCTDHSTCRRCLNQQPEELLLQPSQWQSQCQFSIMMRKHCEGLRLP